MVVDNKVSQAVDNDGALDKESTAYNDIFDAFRLPLKFYHFQGCQSLSILNLHFASHASAVIYYV